MEIFILCAVAYLACVVFVIGVVFAHFQRRWPNVRFDERRSDIFFALFMSIFGPGAIAAFVIYAITTGGYRWHGWLWPWSQKALDELEAS